MQTNELFLPVMPQISLSRETYGKVEEVLTLVPIRAMATEFDDTDVESYMKIFNDLKQYFTARRVVGYDVDKIAVRSGWFIVRVFQRVA
jgi:hypothetical protein